MMTSPELAAAIEAASRASEIAMRNYGVGVEAWQKADRSLVSRADLEAEKAIIEILNGRFPNYRVIGEETGDSGTMADSVWLIDPIDGTYNFVRGIPLFGVQIALLHKGTVVAGVSSLPAMGEMLSAEAGQGAFLNGTRVSVSPTGISEAHISIGGLNYFAANGHGGAIIRVARAVKRMRGFGDAYAYHLVATGRCEAVLEDNIRFWDVAALSVIIREAGGKCSQLDGRPLGLESTTCICSNSAAYADIMQHYAEEAR